MMSDLPYCGICKKQIVNASCIGWYCPTIGCEGDWPQKANIVFDYKTDVQIIKEKDDQISLLKRDYEVMYKLQQGGEARITELESALNEAADVLDTWQIADDYNPSDKYRAIANNKDKGGGDEFIRHIIIFNVDACRVGSRVLFRV